MIYANAWVEIRDDFTWPADNPEDDTELQAKNRETLELCGDIEVIPSIFKTRQQGPRTWQVYSLLYEFPDDVPNLDQAIEQALELFKSENPGQTDVLAAWYYEGNMVGTTLVVTEEPNPDYVGEPFMIPNPDYQPDDQLPDYDPRTEIRNPAWVPETITVKSQTGVPLYSTPGYLSDYMPDVDGVPDPTLRDVNRYAGQPTRVFA
jgi:hypothetical protein